MVQSLEINHFAYEDMYCMFCGEQILYSESPPTPCSHVLFLATDLADEYEHQSGLIKDFLPPIHTEDEDEDEDKNFIDRVREAGEFPADSFIIEIYAAPPVPGAMYIGLSPQTG